MAKKCLYINEKNCIVHVFSSFEKKWKNYEGKLWRTSKMFSNSIQIWKTENKLNEKNIILKRKFQFSNSGFSRKLEYCSIFKQPLNFILQQG